MTLLERDEVPVGERAEVAMHIMLDDRLAEDLRVGARFSLYEGGRRVVAGTVITLLEDVDSE
jgi:translation elongation factor EF-Tu-like GTPase